MRRPAKRPFFFGLSDGRVLRLEDSTEESGLTIPIQGNDEDRRELLCVQAHKRERCKGIASCDWGCSLKSVE